MFNRKNVFYWDYGHVSKHRAEARYEQQTKLYFILGKIKVMGAKSKGEFFKNGIGDITETEIPWTIIFVALSMMFKINRILYIQ